MEEKQIIQYADIFKALSNPNRLRIYVELASRVKEGEAYECDYPEGESSSCQLDMAKALKIAPSTLSHHLKELKNAGLIKILRNGRHVSLEVDACCRTLLKEFAK